MESLLFIVLSEEDITNSGEHSSVVRQFGEDDLIPLESLLSSADYFVDVGDLEDSFGNGDDGLDLFQSLQSFDEQIQLLVDVAQVIQSLNAVSFHTDSLKVEFLCFSKIVLHEEAVSLIDQSSSIVAVVVQSDIHISLSLTVVVLEEIEEGDVGGNSTHGSFVLLLKTLQSLNGSFDFFLLEEGHGFEDFDL